MYLNIQNPNIPHRQTLLQVLNRFLLRMVFTIRNNSETKFISVIFIAGAHSHIRGLGLDDALEPRQVNLTCQRWSVLTPFRFVLLLIDCSSLPLQGFPGDGGTAGIPPGCRVDPGDDQGWAHRRTSHSHRWPARHWKNRHRHGYIPCFFSCLFS